MPISACPGLKKRVSTKASWITEREAGFTLLEIVAVLLLVVLLVSLVFPHFDLVYCRWQENTALLQILRDLKEAESEAAGSGREMRLVFQSGKPYYLLEMRGTKLRRPLAGLVLAGEEEAADEKTVISSEEKHRKSRRLFFWGQGAGFTGYWRQRAGRRRFLSTVSK